MPLEPLGASSYTQIKRLTVESSNAKADRCFSIVRAGPTGATPYRAGSRIVGIVSPVFTLAPSPPASVETLLIPKGGYSAILDAGGTVPYYNGGTVFVKASSTFGGDADTRWTPQQLFNGLRGDFEWVTSGSGPHSLELTFPVRTYVNRIFIIPRVQGDLPSTIRLSVDGITIGTSSQTTVNNALGLQSPVYDGTGFFIQPNYEGTRWRFEFPGSASVALGELEMRGFVYVCK